MSSAAKQQHRRAALLSEPPAVLGGISQWEPQPEPEPGLGQLGPHGMDGVAVYDDDSVAATMFRQWPLVALARLDSVGGGRGVVTTSDITAGTVLMSEMPFFPRPPDGWASGVGAHLPGVELASADYDDVPLHTAVARHLLASREGMWRCAEMMELHPQSLSPPHMSPSQLARAWDSHRGTVNQLMARATAHADSSVADDDAADDAAAVAAAAKPYTREDVLRCICQVQFNAFDSGMYLALAMINHSCNPNCCKFSPPPAAADSCGSNSRNRCSEIVAVVDLPRGTEVTIHYANPPQRSHRARVALFEAQHYFELGPSPYPDELDGPIGSSGGTGVDEEGASGGESEWSAVQRIEEDLDKLDAGGDSARSSLAQAEDCLARATTLGLLPPTHLVVIRAHLAVVRAAQDVIESAVDLDDSITAEDETATVAVALRALGSCGAVSRSMYIPRTHHERATAATDTQVCMLALLHCTPYIYLWCR